MITKVKLIIIYLMLLSISIKAAEPSLNVENIPAPPNSQLIENPGTRSFGGREFEGMSYYSREEGNKIAGHYKNFFSNQGFNEVIDNNLFGDETVRQMKFKKGEDFFEIMINRMPDQEGELQVSVIKYIQPEGAPAIEELRPSVDDSFIPIPRQDEGDGDIDIIPRPDESVRWVSKKIGQNIQLLYAVPLSVSEACRFYKDQMYYKGWELEKDASTGEMMNFYKEQTGKDLAGNFPPVFSGGENMSEVISGSSVLYFNNSYYGKATVTVFANIFGKTKGSFIQILYKPVK